MRKRSALPAKLQAKLLAALLAGAAAGCVHGDADAWEPTKDKTSGKPQVPPGESALLYEVLTEYFAAELRGKGNGVLILVQETVPVTKRRSLTFPQDYPAVHRLLPAAPKACVDAFVRANKQRAQLAAPPPPVVHVVPIKRVNQLFHTGGWTAVRKEQPQVVRLIGAARPGLCDDHATALLFFSGTNDHGLTEVLVEARRDGDEWHIAHKVVLVDDDDG